jgi:peptidoglycan/LPS O-acetylase OafA/YrhL
MQFFLVMPLLVMLFRSNRAVAYTTIVVGIVASVACGWYLMMKVGAWDGMESIQQLSYVVATFC